MERMKVLEMAKEIITGEREMTYGTPEDSFFKISKYWSLYLGREITARDVANLMILLKVARIRRDYNHIDNYIDIAGYAACACDVEGGNKK